MRESVGRVIYREGEALDYSFLPRLDRERSAGRGLDTFLLGIAISAVGVNLGASAVDEFSVDSVESDFLRPFAGAYSAGVDLVERRLSGFQSKEKLKSGRFHLLTSTCCQES